MTNLLRPFCLGTFVLLIGLALGFGWFTLSGIPHHDPPNFLSNYYHFYGYNNTINKIRDFDMKHLNGSVYLDYTGSGLYRTSQMKSIFDEYENTLFANPHSLSPASRITTELVEDARDLVLQNLGTDSSKYTVIFTASTTASLRLLAESFPWTKDSLYLYTLDNHNSVLGIRRWATHYGAKFKVVDEDDLQGQGRPKSATINAQTAHLFAYPLEENFAGKMYPTDWVEKFKNTDFPDKFARGRWYTLLDAAAYLPTNKLDLSQTPADFVVLSFYKMFGYPNLGALIVKNDVFPDLRKMGFSGGTVVMATCGTDFALLQPRGCSRYEDGTIPFLSIIALHHSFKVFNSLGIDNIHNHVTCVTRELFLRLNVLRHENGRPAVRVYGNHNKNDPSKQGGVVALNFVNPDGGYVGYNEVMKAAAREKINLRVGCFCNPGGCQRASGLNDQQVEQYYKKKTSCHDGLDIINGVPLGAVRISLGAYTTMEDIEAFTAFVKKYFVK